MLTVAGAEHQRRQRCPATPGRRWRSPPPPQQTLNAPSTNAACKPRRTEIRTTVRSGVTAGPRAGSVPPTASTTSRDQQIAPVLLRSALSGLGATAARRYRRAVDESARSDSRHPRSPVRRWVTLPRLRRCECRYRRAVDESARADSGHPRSPVLRWVARSRFAVGWARISCVSHGGSTVRSRA